MIRIVRRRLIIPCGDTGTFTLPLLETAQAGDVAVLTIYDPLHQKILLKKTQVIPVSEDNTFTFSFVRSDTIDLPPSNKYQWDVKIYRNPVFDENNEVVDGEDIDSYYAAFKLPTCEIRVAP